METYDRIEIEVKEDEAGVLLATDPYWETQVGAGETFWTAVACYAALRLQQEDVDKDLPEWADILINGSFDD